MEGTKAESDNLFSQKTGCSWTRQTLPPDAATWQTRRNMQFSPIRGKT